MLGCCASAASGHATAAPPSSVKSEIGVARELLRKNVNADGGPIYCDDRGWR